MKHYTEDQIEEATAYVLAHHEPTIELLNHEPVMLLVFITFATEILATLKNGDYEDV